MIRSARANTLQISEPVCALARTARTAFDPDAPLVAIDPALVDFAIQRHRVGPLLYARAREGAVRLDRDAELRLKRHAEANAKRAAMAEWLQARIVRHLGGTRIPSLIFKGGSLARRLYGDVMAIPATSTCWSRPNISERRRPTSA